MREPILNRAFEWIDRSGFYDHSIILIIMVTLVFVTVAVKEAYKLCWGKSNDGEFGNTLPDHHPDVVMYNRRHHLWGFIMRATILMTIMYCLNFNVRISGGFKVGLFLYGWWLSWVVYDAIIYWIFARDIRLALTTLYINIVGDFILIASILMMTL